MKFIKCIIFLVILLETTITIAQKENIFLQRSYWQLNPSISDIEEKIKEGHNITALNEHFFDAVSWALIEKTDNTTIKYLLTKQGNDVNKLTHDARTYIFWAAYRDNLEMMKFLVNQGAKTDIIDSHGYSLLNFTAVTGQLNTKLYDFCIAHGADIVNEKNKEGANALLLVAPFIKEYSFIEYFTSKGIDLHSTDQQGNGIFNYASKRGNTNLLDILVKKGVAYKGLNNNNGNAMLFASNGTRGHTNSLATYQFLEKLGIAPNVTTKKGQTPLHALAYKSKETDVLGYFLSKGVSINSKDHTGRTALTNAVQWGTTKVVDFLVANGADVSVKDNQGNTLAYYLLHSFDADQPEMFNKKLTTLTKQGFDIKERSEKNGGSLYHIALDKNNITLLKRIKAFDIDVNTKNKEGITPLHKAAMTAKDESILKYLLSIGADKNIKTDFEESVYDLASENELLQKNKIAINFLK
ncbi:ankyrin repeat domain-containing protein [Aquimarina pacifica]|uniref:ankyrin repeat domain-containing protein n=1 Tax=Aquimarina pacifica TaxID=1296415 RepID=UPI00046F0B4E|nr:ankyrin repeat domain-containing protein [Aquimarina pacifica]